PLLEVNFEEDYVRRRFSNAVECRQFLAARDAPCGPEVDHHDVAAEVGETHELTARSVPLEVGGVRADAAGGLRLIDLRANGADVWGAAGRWKEKRRPNKRCERS